MDESNMTDRPAEHAAVESTEPVGPMAEQPAPEQESDPESAPEFEEGVLGDQGPWVADETDDNEENDA